MGALDVAIKVAREGQYNFADLSSRDRNMAELGVRRIVAAGYRIIAPGELDQVTLEKAAEVVGAEMCVDGEWADEVVAAIRALNTGGE